MGSLLPARTSRNSLPMPKPTMPRCNMARRDVALQMCMNVTVDKLFQGFNGEVLLVAVAYFGQKLVRQDRYVRTFQASCLHAGRILGLDVESARELSPALKFPNSGVKVGCAVGEMESEEFWRQSSELAKEWGATFLEVKRRSHFDVTTDLMGGGPLADLALELASVPPVRSKVASVS